MLRTDQSRFVFASHINSDKTKVQKTQILQKNLISKNKLRVSYAQKTAISNQNTIFIFFIFGNKTDLRNI